MVVLLSLSAKYSGVSAITALDYFSNSRVERILKRFVPKLPDLPESPRNATRSNSVMRNMEDAVSESLNMPRMASESQLSISMTVRFRLVLTRRKA